MKVSELQSLLENYHDKQLREIVVALYKAIPRRIREENQLNEFLKDPDSYPGKGKRSKKKEKIPDIKFLESEIEEFLTHAYDQNYLAPNRIIPKRERRKWRFKVTGFTRI